MRKTTLDNRQDSLVAAAAGHIAASAAAKAHVGRAARKSTGRTGRSCERTGGTSVIQSHELSDKRRVAQLCVSNKTLTVGFLCECVGSCDAQNISVDVNAQAVRFQNHV